MHSWIIGGNLRVREATAFAKGALSRASFVSALTVVLLSGCLSQSQSNRSAPARRSPGSGPAGTVETLAGPGFCARTSIRDRSSEEVGALTLDQEGRIFFETGPAEDGSVAVVERNGRVSKLKHLTARGPYIQDGERLQAPAAGRLAADGEGGVFIAAGSKVVQLDGRGALRNIAGDQKHPPSPRGSGSSGDGGPAEAARFSSARSVLSDEAGNLYIADAPARPGGQFSIRFVNRTPQPIIFYRATPFEITVHPGQIQTIAGGGGTGEIRPETSLSGTMVAMALSESRLYVATSSGGRRGRAPKATLTLINHSGGPISAHGISIEPGVATSLSPKSGAPKGEGRRRGAPVNEAPASALAADISGNLYLADATGHRVLKIEADGSRAIFAGATSGQSSGGFNGNDRRARGARLNTPYSLAIGPDGRVYISDQKNKQVRVVDQTGVIRAAPGAGIGLSWACKDGRPSSDATPRPGGPAGIAADSRGGAFFSNTTGNQVKGVGPSGEVRNIAGTGRPAACPRRPGNRGSDRAVRLAEARLNGPGSLALASGGIYVMDCDNSRISFINARAERVRVHGVNAPPRSVVTIAGSGTPGFGGDGKQATAALIGGRAGPSVGSPADPFVDDPDARQPTVPLGGLATDSKGNLYVADTGNGHVRQINGSGVISTVAGEGVNGSRGECCRRPSALAVDGSDNLYVLDVASLRVWFLNNARLPVNVKGIRIPARSAAPVAGNGTVGFEGEGGPAAQAQLLFPTGIALDRRDTLYIVEVGAALGMTLLDPVIRGVDVRSVDRGGRIRTILGPGHVGFNGDGLKSNLTSLSFPTGIAVDRCGNLLITDVGSDRVRRVNVHDPC